MESNSNTVSQFRCVIANPGHVTTAERIGHFLQKDSVMRAATITFKDGALSLDCIDMYGTSVMLLKLPTNQVARVTHHVVGVGSQVKSEAASCSGWGFGMGVTVCVIIFFKLTKVQGPIDMGKFLPIGLVALAVFTGIGYVWGLVKGLGSAKRMVEFRIGSTDREILHFRVDPAEQQKVCGILRNVGWNSVPGSAI